MEIVINPIARQVWRSPSALQIGFDENRVVLENLQPRHTVMIQALYSGLTLEQAREYGRHLKMRVSETQALISALKPVLLTRTERVRQTNSFGETLEDNLELGEAMTIAFESPIYQRAIGEINQATKKFAARGETIWLRRQSNAVFISTLDRTGLLIVEALAAAGIGAIVTGDLTESRITQTLELLDELPARPQFLKLPQLSETQLSRLDLAILVGHQIIEPQKFAAWMNRGTPQLGAIFASVAEGLSPLVSHVIVPAVTPCWICLEMQRCSADGAWPAIASQLIGREDRFDSSAARLFLAARVVEKTLDHIDSRNGFSRGQVQIKWGFSPECSCRLGAAQT